jgi:hypothetical protein
VRCTGIEGPSQQVTKLGTTQQSHLLAISPAPHVALNDAGPATRPVKMAITSRMRANIGDLDTPELAFVHVFL